MQFLNSGISYSNLRSILLLVILLGAVFLIVAVVLALKQRKIKAVTGKGELIGDKGVARKKISSESGLVFIEGELWEARTSGEVINTGEKVEVIEVDGLTLKVKKIE